MVKKGQFWMIITVVKKGQFWMIITVVKKVELVMWWLRTSLQPVKISRFHWVLKKSFLVIIFKHPFTTVNKSLLSCDFIWWFKTGSFW